MKYCYLLALTLGVASALAQAPTTTPRPYFRGDLGVAITEDANVDFFPGAGSVSLDLDPGMRFSVAGGAEFGPYFALELETGWIFNEIDSIPGFIDVDGFISQVPFVINAVVQFKNQTGLTPFFGAGAGGAVVGLNLDDADSPTVELDGSAGDAVFAWQAFGGLKFNINENFSVGLVYKYFWSDDAEWEVEDTLQDILFEGTRTHSVSAMVSYRF